MKVYLNKTTLDQNVKPQIKSQPGLPNRHSDFSIGWSYAPILLNCHMPNQNIVTNRVNSLAISYKTRFFVAFEFHMQTMALKSGILIRKPRDVCVLVFREQTFNPKTSLLADLIFFSITWSARGRKLILLSKDCLGGGCASE